MRDSDYNTLAAIIADHGYAVVLDTFAAIVRVDAETARKQEMMQTHNAMLRVARVVERAARTAALNESSL